MMRLGEDNNATTADVFSVSAFTLCDVSFLSCKKLFLYLKCFTCRWDDAE